MLAFLLDPPHWMGLVEMVVKRFHHIRLYASSWTAVDSVIGDDDVEELVRIGSEEHDRVVTVIVRDDHEV